jgi:3-oxoisoapionate decarboxylase
MTRRELLSLAATAPVWAGPAAHAQTKAPQAKSGGVAQSRVPVKMGGAPPAFSVRQKAPAFDIVEQCRKLGFSGVQTSLEGVELDAIAKLGKRVKAYGMELILDTPALPVEEGQLYRYDFALQACKTAGARCLRAALADRRYEQPDSAQTFQRSFDRVKSYVSLAVPMLEKEKIRLAVENHGDWRGAELADWINRLGCDYVGVCFDFAENMALCEDPMDTLQKLAPFTFMCHIKDVAVEAYQDGFLLADAPLGEGILNLKEMVRILREKDPKMPFYLDMATADPVKVPVSTEKYRGAFGANSPLTDKDVANILDVVRRSPPKKPLPQVSAMSQAEAAKLEDERNLKCIDWARKNL